MTGTLHSLGCISTLLAIADVSMCMWDYRMLIERFIENPHHIEIQVLADTHGNVVAFPER